MQVVKFHCSRLLTFTVLANFLLCQTNLSDVPQILAKLAFMVQVSSHQFSWHIAFIPCKQILMFTLFDCSDISALGIPMSKIRYFVLSFCSSVWMARHSLSTCHLCVDHAGISYSVFCISYFVFRYFVLSFYSSVWMARHALSTCHLCVDHSCVQSCTSSVLGHTSFWIQTNESLNRIALPGGKMNLLSDHLSNIKLKLSHQEISRQPNRT